MNSVTMIANLREFDQLDRTFDESIFYHLLTQVFLRAEYPKSICPDIWTSGSEHCM